MTIAVRAYARGAHRPEPSNRTRPKPVEASGFTLIFDTETFVDAAQQLRIGTYQWRDRGDLREAGIFYDPESVTARELQTVMTFAESHGLELLPARSFVDDIFYGLAYELNATIVGFNLPFDLSRLSIGYTSARGNMRGGFTLKLSENPLNPNVRVRHLSSRSAFIRFAGRKQPRIARSARKRGRKEPSRPGHFLDVRTAASAVLGGSHTLRSLAEMLETPTQKLDLEDFAGEITPEFLDYAVADPQVTWECYERVAARYEGFGLSTPLTRIYSEASVGKASLREMGVARWRAMEPEFPDEMLGIIMSTYSGGRSEVHVRRQIRQVHYYDFHATYPSICVLTGMWRFVTATGIDDADATKGTIRFLERVTLDDLRDPRLWSRLSVLVQVIPDDDVLPVRAIYGTEGSYTIGLNHLSADRPMWFTLADAINAKLLSGKAPRIVHAIRFSPRGTQAGLRSIDLLGRPEYRVDPRTDDFYRRLVDLRSETERAKTAALVVGEEAEAHRLEAAQQALKIIANATSYGIFVELNVDTQDRLRELNCFGLDGDAFAVWGHNLESPGSFFHPLLATLITGAARLLLGTAEALAARAGIDWAVCDTDSMVLAKPETMDPGVFLQRAERVRRWFDELDPYGDPETPFFKVEDANLRVARGIRTSELAPLYCLAISAKRFCLFNIDGRGRPVIRKASAHGLGHLRPPYGPKASPRSIPAPVVALRELEVERWEYDLWYRIIQAALRAHPERVRTADAVALDAPAVSRYAATTPGLLRWFKAYNKGKPYREQVRPFGFLLAFQPDATKLADANVPRVVAPFDPDPAAAAGSAFDRETGKAVPIEALKTYRRALAQYHLQPEAKFAGADYLDAGTTSRRHIQVAAVNHIGKEANRWEEQFYLGQDPEAQITYGMSPHDETRLRDGVLRACAPFKVREIARESALSVSTVSEFLRGKGRTSVESMISIMRALSELRGEDSEKGTPGD